MSGFDWASFVARYNIDHVSRGPSTASGNLYVHCPWCGAADSGHHMGLSLRGRGWGCWKNSQHRGRNPTRLVAALLGVSHAEAARITGVKSLPGVSAGQMEAMLRQLTEGPLREPQVPPVMPEEFSSQWESRTARPFVEYMLERGFTREDTSWLVGHFDLRFALHGDFRYRIVVPVLDRHGHLHTWTGRAVNSDARIKYKTLSTHAVSPPTALGPPTDVLLDLPRLFEGGDVLVVAEGPFDAMRLALCARGLGIRATCLFGKAVSTKQLGLLAQLRDRYRRMFVVLDPDAVMDLVQVAPVLLAVGAEVWPLSGDDDPGEMPAELILEHLNLMLDM